MDIFSHGLYGGAGFYNKSKKSFWTAFAFGIFPDVAAFGLFFVTLFINLGLGKIDFTKFEPPTRDFAPQYVHTIYNFTHSIFIFAAVFIIVWIILKKPILEMLAWGLHILMDIPTHSHAFFPTPFLFPFSSYSFDGISWASQPFFTINWIVLILLYGYLIFRRKYKIIIIKIK